MNIHDLNIRNQPSPVNTAELRNVNEWLIDGARSVLDPQLAVAELCARLRGCGIPLWRVAMFVRTLHPHVVARRFLWRLDTEVELEEYPFDSIDTGAFRNSPIAHIYATGDTIRRRLADPDCAIDFPILQDLRMEGVTDYLASPLVFTYGEIQLATWTTRQPGGFTDSQMAALNSIITPLARVAEIRALRRTAGNLLNTYVGTHAGERILAGQIRRGHTEAIHAAIWLSDMRGFTALIDRLPSQTLIDLLNSYFDCQVPAIHNRGGEVLKFMGDGLLAIFPLASDGTNARKICNDALAAACEAREKIVALSGSSGIHRFDELRFGLALHLGEVLYGNIGGGNRLDFTCIGPAVNLAARIERLSGRLGRMILASDEFARHCAADLLPVGNFTLSGFGAPRMLFGLRDETL
jgi:adenylate cyclase